MSLIEPSMAATTNCDANYPCSHVFTDYLCIVRGLEIRSIFWLILYDSWWAVDDEKGGGGSMIKFDPQGR
jgi:hypothetical protein